MTIVTTKINVPENDTSTLQREIAELMVNALNLEVSAADIDRKSTRLNSSHW